MCAANLGELACAAAVHSPLMRDGTVRLRTLMNAVRCPMSKSVVQLRRIVGAASTPSLMAISPQGVCAASAARRARADSRRRRRRSATAVPSCFTRVQCHRFLEGGSGRCCRSRWREPTHRCSGQGAVCATGARGRPVSVPRQRRPPRGGCCFPHTATLRADVNARRSSGRSRGAGRAASPIRRMPA